MRRKDRELTKKEDMLQILEACKVCRLGLSEENQPYVLPLNFGYSWPEQQGLTMYFHCAREGRKLDILAKNSRACFELDCGHELVAGEKPCDYSFRFASLIGFGQAEIIEEPTAKRLALQKIMERQVGPGVYSFTDRDVDGVVVFCLRATEVTGKQNAPK